MSILNQAATHIFTAWDTGNSVRKTDDEANITVQISLDGAKAAAVSATVQPVLLADNSPSGRYSIFCSAAEKNAQRECALLPTSSTVDIVCEDIIILGGGDVTRVAGVDITGVNDFKASVTGLATEQTALNTAATVNVIANRITAARAGYLDNLNIGGPVAASYPFASLSTFNPLVDQVMIDSAITFNVNLQTIVGATAINEFPIARALDDIHVYVRGNTVGDKDAGTEAFKNASGNTQFTYEIDASANRGVS